MTEVLFDFYNLLVENIFGSIAMSILGVLFVMLLILFITRTSAIFIIYWSLFYLVVMMTLYIGALGLVLASMIALSYSIIAGIRFWLRPD